MKKLLSVLLTVSMLLTPISAYSLDTEKKRIVQNNATLKEEGQRITKNFGISLDKNAVFAVATICVAALVKKALDFSENITKMKLEANSPGWLYKMFKGMPKDVSEECKRILGTTMSFLGFNKLAGVKNILFQVLNGATLIAKSSDWDYLTGDVWNTFKKLTGDSWNYLKNLF